MALFLPNLKQSGFLETLHLTICDVGSRKVSAQQDYGSQAWGLFAPNLTIYGFDADAQACEDANANLLAGDINWVEIHLPYALAKSVGSQTLYLTQSPFCHSLYPPNDPLLRYFPRISSMMSLVDTLEVQTTTLDTICQSEDINEINFLQIDVQGADLSVLEGAQQLLQRSVLAIQVEVLFSPLYVGQPLFSDIDQFLRQQDFMLFDLTGAAHESRSPLCSTAHPGQLLWADAIYFRHPFQAKSSDFYTQPEQILKLACIADILDFTDYALELMTHLTLEHGTQPHYNLADSVVQSLSQVMNMTQDMQDQIPAIAKLKNFLT
jgi:FkbM family methyltransferase